MKKGQPTYIPFQEINDEDSFLTKVMMKDIDRVALNEKPHRHNFHEIFFIKRGSGKQLIDEEIIPLENQTFYLIGKGQVHEFIEGKNIDGYLICFKNDFIPAADYNTPTAFNASLLARLQKTNAIKITKEDTDDFELLFQQLLKEYQKAKNTFGRISTIQHLLLTILIRLEQCSRKNTLSKDNFVSRDILVYREFLLLLEDHFHTQKKIEFYAKSLGVNKRKLAEIAQKQAGKSTKQIIQDRLITESKRLLSYTNSSLKEIAFRLGFEDSSYFCHFFKKHTNMRPTQYKNSVSQ